LDIRLLHLIATVIDACDQQPSRGPGHPPTETIRVVATLRRFLREGTPWRSLTAMCGRPPQCKEKMEDQQLGQVRSCVRPQQMRYA
jgi:hypothetical protein